MPELTPINNLFVFPDPKKNFRIFIILGLVFFAGVMLMCGVIYYSYQDKTNQILAHKGFTHGEILASYHAYKSPKYVFEYDYKIHGAAYMGEQLISEGLMKDSLLNNTFPVVYDTTAKRNRYTPFPAYLLITPDDFKKFNMPFPDSLKWVKKYIK